MVAAGLGTLHEDVFRGARTASGVCGNSASAARATGKRQSVLVRLQPDDLSALDAWAAKQYEPHTQGRKLSARWCGWR